MTCKTPWAEIVLWQNGKVLHSFLAEDHSVEIGKQFLVSSAFQNTEPSICTITKVKNGCEVKNMSFQAIYVITDSNHRTGHGSHNKHTPKDLAKGESWMLFWETSFNRQLKEAATFEDLQDKGLQSMCFSKLEFKRNGEHFGIGITFVEAWDKIRKASAAKMFGLENGELNRTVSLSQSDAQRFKLPVFRPSSSPLRNRALPTISDREEVRSRKSSIVRDMVNSFTTQMENKENHLTPTLGNSCITPKNDLIGHPPRSSARKLSQLYSATKKPILQQSLIELDEEIKLLDLAVLKIMHKPGGQHTPNLGYKKISHRSEASESSPDEFMLKSELIKPKIRTFSAGTLHPDV
ncbi:unnamed protein product [Bursaphelenchus xylophilus]|uniref:(pine wood nematode) hypothetical protein n=1 Tax=Bursaphelenchus xylophilus TaxID=6326 RepID=A0A1I7S8N1_BURXY|nr:unnamed protein product [Bursaphelenchus xylophilus]CAG9089451.1 unnamed protein product [Bursaphelenchus xylophilus]